MYASAIALRAQLDTAPTTWYDIEAGIICGFALLSVLNQYSGTRSHTSEPVTASSQLKV